MLIAADYIAGKLNYNAINIKDKEYKKGTSYYVDPQTNLLEIRSEFIIIIHNYFHN